MPLIGKAALFGVAVRKQRPPESTHRQTRHCRRRGAESVDKLRMLWLRLHGQDQPERRTLRLRLLRTHASRGRECGSCGLVETFSANPGSHRPTLAEEHPPTTRQRTPKTVEIAGRRSGP